MEFFYREMRRQHAVLMDGGVPVADRWNFDAENRKRLPAGVPVPEPPQFQPDAITQDVIALVRARFGDHFGTCDGFNLPVTAADARLALDDFVANRLPQFGDWQDAMKTGAPTLFHALVSTSINAGLLDPRLAVQAAEAAWRAGTVPLNAAEGFIRQIIGWREFVRGIYWLKMPDYAQLNALAATRALPQFYWDANTRMNCMHHAIADTRAHAYAHHIQRLMVTGNFALLAGLDPADVDEWYLIVYADAYEWVEMPNVRGMALFGDGGDRRVQAVCRVRRLHQPHERLLRPVPLRREGRRGERGCPFNALYWDFMARHAAALRRQPAHGDAAAHAGADGPGPGRGPAGTGRGVAGGDGCRGAGLTPRRGRGHAAAGAAVRPLTRSSR